MTSYTEKGIAKQPHPLGYSEDYYGAYEMILAYHKGEVYTPKENRETVITFKQIYEGFYEEKYESDKSYEYSEATKRCSHTAFANCAVLHDQDFRQLRYDDLQAVVDDCNRKFSSKKNIVNLMHQLYKYAIKHDITEKNYSQFLKVKQADDSEHGVPFSDEDIKILWQHTDDDMVSMLLIMIYSGYRISAYKTLEINRKEWYFKGGVKTAASKDRIVPIHTAIRPLVTSRLKRLHELFPYKSGDYFRADMYAKLSELGIEQHTPHDCRHTFSRLCEKYSVRENDRKRLLGHSFGQDITNQIYGHRTVEELRAEVEKIRAPI